MIPLKPIVFRRGSLWYAVSCGTGYVYYPKHGRWLKAISQATVFTLLVTAIRTGTACQVKGLKNASLH
ncbi:hypothetical protein [Escherichia phage PH1062]|nr:hypothetical protein [Escherichia phage PH1062]